MTFMKETKGKTLAERKNLFVKNQAYVWSTSQLKSFISGFEIDESLKR